VDQAWVVSVDMGYGHQRAAYPFRDIAYEGIITANTGAMVDPAERKRWMILQGLYEGVSRVNRVPVIGPWLWRTYDRFQAISPHYPFRDRSKPTFGSMRLDRLMGRGFISSVVEHTRRREDLPLLTTFFAVALAADYQGRKHVFCVVTDSDVNRIWVAREPSKSRIHYLAPTPLNRQRLMAYGVPAERITFTGFPLPPENVAAAAEDLRRRLAVLDARGAFRRGYGRMIDAELGPAPAAGATPMSITYAVGGAGAQAELARDILQGLSGALREGRMRLNLVAGVRAEVEQYFRRVIGELGLEAELGRSIRLLLAPTKDEYFAKFNQLLRETDVLWTKPSELCFYPALGIPLVMSAPLGAHEERNLETVLRVGAGQRQLDPRAAAEWLTDWANNGLLALNAFQGYFHMPRMGTENIKRLMFAPDRSQVAMDLGAVLPERTE
jgi:Domain of unknown function (DUF6938)